MCVRFGNEIFINEYGMRSPNFSAVKQEKELRDPDAQRRRDQWRQFD